MNDADRLAEAAAILEASEDYRVLRRLKPRDRFCDADHDPSRNEISPANPPSNDQQVRVARVTTPVKR